MSARDSGKPLVDAAFGEVLGTCEKIWWLCKEGEHYLKPDRRSAGFMVCRAGGRRSLACLGWDGGENTGLHVARRETVRGSSA